GMTTLLAQAARFFGLRLVHRSDAASVDSVQMRLDLAQLFAVTTSVACLVAGDALQAAPVTPFSLWNEFIYGPGPVAAIGVATAWAVLWDGRWLGRVLLIMGCAAIVGIGQ